MASPKPRSGILGIEPHMEPAGGGSLRPAAINLASNESAFGPGAAAIEAGKAAMSAPERYTEDAQRRLAGAIGERFDLPESGIAVGHGSDDILARLARAYLSPGSELVRSRNGYLKVPNYALANDAVPVSAPDKNFRASVEGIIGCISSKTRMVYLANPDNPTGSWLGADELRALHLALPSDVVLVIDAAYEEYVDAPDFLPAARLVEEAENVVMTRTFSKIFGLAGLRLGWAYGPPGICDAVRRIGTTFPISTPGQAAGMAALADRAHTEMVFEANRSMRATTSAELQTLGLEAYPSQGNFILIGFPEGGATAKGAYAALAGRGIAVRRFVSKSFDPCIRMTIGFEHEVAAAIDALRDYVEGHA